MRRILTVALAACLVSAVFLGSAGAKKKPRPPVKFTESGSVAVGHTGDVVRGTNVTRQAFLRDCAVPVTQGTDGYVITLPEKITVVRSWMAIEGADLVGVHDLDLSFFDEDCAPTGSLATDAGDEIGLVEPGSKYVLVTAFFGTGIEFEFRALEARL